MNPALNQRSPVAKAGWLIGLFIVGWLAFLFIPWPHRSPPSDSPSKMMVNPPSKLQAVGLADNVDWEGLPEFFAIWADRAEWKGNWTRFAYWNPMTKDFTYHFEATKVEGGYRFKEIPAPNYPTDYWPWPWDDSLGEDCPVRFYRTPPAWPGGGVEVVPKMTRGSTGKDNALKVKVEIAAPMTLVPGVKVPLTNPAPKP